MTDFAELGYLTDEMVELRRLVEARNTTSITRLDLFMAFSLLANATTDQNWHWLAQDVREQRITNDALLLNQLAKEFGE